MQAHYISWLLVVMCLHIWFIDLCLYDLSTVCLWCDHLGPTCTCRKSWCGSSFPLPPLPPSLPSLPPSLPSSLPSSLPLFTLHLCCLTPPCSPDAHRAVELLEEYRRRLQGTQNEQLREALTKAIVAIRSRLFQALLGMCMCVCVSMHVYIRLRNLIMRACMHVRMCLCVSVCQCLHAC